MEKRIKARAVDGPPSSSAPPDPQHVLQPGSAFEGIEGQNTAVGVLQAALRHGTLAHAYLFTGAPGVGRELTARRLAAALLCTGRQSSQPADHVCGACPSCVRVMRRLHPDLHVCLSEAEMVARGVVEWNEDRRPSPEIRVEQIRGLRDALRMAAFEGGWRVAIIPQADRMRVEAANALLKTLEEPLPHSLLVLCAPDRRSVLETLVSRCQRVGFAPLEESVLAQLVQKRRGLDADTALAVAREAGGSASRALSEDPAAAAHAWQEARSWLDALERSGPAELSDRAEAMEKDRDHLESQVHRLARLATRDAEALLAQARDAGHAAVRARYLGDVAAGAMSLLAELSRPGVNVRLSIERFSLQHAGWRTAGGAVGME